MNKGKVLLIGGFLALIAFAILFTSTMVTNDIENYQVKQAFITGKMSVKFDAGMYPKMFAKITTNKKTGILHFSKDKLDGGDGLDTQPLNCTFQGNSTAKIDGVLKYRLPVTEQKALIVNKDYGSNEAIKNELIRNTMASALKQVGPMFTAEEAFTTRRAEFTELVRLNIVEGLVSTITKVIERKSDDDTTKILKQVITRMRRDKDGNPIIKEPSMFSTLGFSIIQLDIKDFDFDPLTDSLIQKKKKAEQQQVVARSNARKAQQDAITAFEQGQADIATARAEQEVIKITAVTQAEKQRDVEKLNDEKSKYVASKILRVGKSKAKVNDLLNKAGLTPLRRAEIEKETKIGMAEAWAKRPVPKMVIGGGQGGGGTDPLAPLGYKAMLDMVNDLDKH